MKTTHLVVGFLMLSYSLSSHWWHFPRHNLERYYHQMINMQYFHLCWTLNWILQVEYLTDWMNDWLTNWFLRSDWLTGWLTDLRSVDGWIGRIIDLVLDGRFVFSAYYVLRNTHLLYLSTNLFFILNKVMSKINEKLHQDAVVFLQKYLQEVGVALSWNQTRQISKTQ